MNKKFIKLVIAVPLWVSFIPFLIGQPEQPKLTPYPLKYNLPLLNMSLLPEKEENKLNSGIPWIIFIDRVKLDIYEEPGVNPTPRNFNFADWYIVVDETLEFIKIVKDPNFTTRLSSKHKVIGWVKKSEVLLWKYPYVTDTISKVRIKGLLMNTETVINDKDIDFNKVNFYYDPDCKFKSEYTENLWHIFYVYKETANSVLLCKEGIIKNQDDASKWLVGWVPRNRVILWNSRLCIEPNPEKNAVEERKNGSVKVTIFGDQLAPKDMRDGKFNSSNMGNRPIIWNDDTYDTTYRAGFFYRYPYLKMLESDVAEIAFFGGLHSDEIIIDDTTLAGIRGNIEKIIDELRNINIVFVIDGSTSMKNFFPYIIHGIEKSADEITKTYNNQFNKMQYGFVIYRDMAEEKRMIEYQVLTDDLGRFKSKLLLMDGDKIDKTPPEALYWGLRCAFEMTGMKPFKDSKETNVIILVGDAGDNDSTSNKLNISPNNIINYFVDYHCHLAAFQLQNLYNKDYDYDYDNFIEEIKKIMELSNEHAFNNRNTAFDGNIPPKTPQLIHTENEKLWRINDPSLCSYLWYSTKSYVNYNKSSFLEEKVGEAIGGINYYVNRIVQDLRTTNYKQHLTENDDKPKITPEEPSKIFEYEDYSGFVRPYLESIYGYYNVMNAYSKGMQFSTLGWTPLRINNLNQPLYTNFILMDRDELMALYMVLKKLSEGLSNTNLRDHLVEVFEQTIRSAFGEKQDYAGKSLKNLTIGKLMSIIWGVPPEQYYSPLKDITIDQLKRADIINDNKIGVIAYRLESNARKVDALYNDPDKSSSFWFKSNDIYYYWVPMNYLP